MSSKKKPICPVFPDMICPQGEEMSKQCMVRINGDFDPMHYFRDHLLMNCAIYRSREEEIMKKEKK